MKILDFGLAKVAEPQDPAEATQSPTVSGYTEPGKVMGTVGYMSPEQVRGLPLDHRSDIFSFGTVLFEMLTGGRAFQRETAAETMTAILKEEPAVSSSLLSGEAASLVPVLRHCLEKKPERRYQSARDLAYALETASTATGAAAAVPEPPKKKRAALRWLGALALAAAAAIAAYVLRGSRTEPSVPELGDATLFSLTTDPGYEGEPTFSPDGKTIAYVADRDGNFEIYLQQIAGGPALNLTQNSAADIQPSFSPDGREIAFVSGRSEGSEIMHAAPNFPLVGGGIWIMPTLGGPARRIVEEGNCPSWTPDGKELLYVHGTFRSPRMSRVAASGGASRDIPIEEANPARYFFPSLSEDGLWLLYQNGDQIQVVPSAGGKPKVLARGQAPSWGAESKSILFTTTAAGKGRSLWTAPFSAAKGELSEPARPMTFGSGIDAGGKSSRDGTVIAYSAIDETLNLEALPFDAEKGRATGAPRVLTSGNNHISFFDPSPDGKVVAFAAGSGRRSHLWRIEGAAPAVELTRDPAYADNWPEWSPDGREIAFARSGVGDSLATHDSLDHEGRRHAASPRHRFRGTDGVASRRKHRLPERRESGTTRPRDGSHQADSGSEGPDDGRRGQHRALARLPDGRGQLHGPRSRRNRRRRCAPSRDRHPGGVSPILLTLGTMAVFPAIPRESVPRSRTGPGLGDGAAGEGHELQRPGPLHREPENLAGWLDPGLHAGEENRRHRHPPPGGEGREALRTL